MDILAKEQIGRVIFSSITWLFAFLLGDISGFEYLIISFFCLVVVHLGTFFGIKYELKKTFPNEPSRGGSLDSNELE